MERGLQVQEMEVEGRRMEMKTVQYSHVEQDGDGEPVPMISPDLDWIEVANQNPNHIGLATSLEKSDWTPKVLWLRYCEACQQAVSQFE